MLQITMFPYEKQLKSAAFLTRLCRIGSKEPLHKKTKFSQDNAFPLLKNNGL